VADRHAVKAWPAMIYGNNFFPFDYTLTFPFASVELPSFGCIVSHLTTIPIEHAHGAFVKNPCLTQPITESFSSQLAYPPPSCMPYYSWVMIYFFPDTSVLRYERKQAKAYYAG
jgi:hypothetical protein